MGWFGKVDTSDGKTHQVYKNRDGSYDSYKQDSPVRGCGTHEVTRAGSLSDLKDEIERNDNTTVTGARRD